MAEAQREGTTGQPTAAEAVVQLRRTADFLRSLPIARLSRGEPTVADRGRQLANWVVSVAADIAPEQRPPADAALPTVGDQAVGDLIGMVARELEYVSVAATSVDSKDAQVVIAELIRDCIQLRRTG